MSVPPQNYGPPQQFPGAQQVQQSQMNWTYGLPPGVRPDLLRSSLGQHGAMAGSVWQRSGARRTNFVQLVIVELLKLAGTMSDRMLLALSPLMMGLVAWGASATGGFHSGTFAGQVFPMTFTGLFGPLLVYVTIIKSVAGEWHYRSVQYTLILQPSRWRYSLAQLAAIAFLWVVLSVITFAISWPIAMSTANGVPTANLLLERPLVAVSALVLATAAGLLFSFTVGVWLRNPTLAITAYLLSQIGLLVSYALPNPYAGFFDPYQVVAFVQESNHEIIPTVGSMILWSGVLTCGFLVVTGRDAN